MGARLFRNDNGLGRRLRTDARFFYGLGVGTSDLIGWMPVEITEAMVGSRVAVFVAFEVKRGSDRLSTEQRAFLRTVTEAGGRAAEIRSVEEAENHLRRE